MAQRPITIYTRGACSYCFRAKRLLGMRGLAYTEIDASDWAVRDDLEVRTGSTTVPQIYIGERHVGGFTELRALDDSRELATIAFE